MKARFSLCHALAGTIVLLALAAVVCAAAPTPAPAVTHVRLWRTALHGLPALRVSLLPEGHHAAPHELGGAGPGYQFGEYVDLPAGPGRFEVFAGTDKKPLGSLPVELRADTFATVLVSDPDKEGEAPRIELIDDGGSGPATVAQVSVWNLVADLKDVRVTFGENLTAQFAPGIGMLLMRGIAPAVYEVRTSGVSASGEPFQWTNEVDFRRYRRQTLLIYPDPYGRIRPRIAVDGEAPAEAPDKQGSQR